MTACRRFVLRMILAVAILLPVAAQAQTEASFDIGRYTFETGGEVPSMRVGYVTWGKLNNAKDNAILLVPGTSGSRHSYDAYIGPGKAYDTDKYFVIGADPHRAIRFEHAVWLLWLWLAAIPLASVALTSASAREFQVKPIAERKIAQLPTGQLFWRIDTFPTLAQAQTAACGR